MRFDKDMRVKVRQLYAARHEPEAFRLLASAYWYFLLFLTTLLMLGGIAYGAWEFTRSGKDNGPSVTVRSPQSSFTKQQLQSLILKFEDRARKFEERRTAPAAVRDPS